MQGLLPVLWCWDMTSLVAGCACVMWFFVFEDFDCDWLINTWGLISGGVAVCVLYIGIGLLTQSSHLFVSSSFVSRRFGYLTSCVCLRLCLQSAATAEKKTGQLTLFPPLVGHLCMCVYLCISVTLRPSASRSETVLFDLVFTSLLLRWAPHFCRKLELFLRDL